MRRQPNAWDRFYRFQQAPWRGERRLDDLRPWLGPGRILELGVGNGKTLGPLQAAGHDVVGLDVSWNILGRITGPRVLADAAKLPFGQAFDTVLDLHCTGHLLAAERRAAHLEQARVLRPGGHVVVQRLHVEDLRASKGTEVEPGTRELADGRRTHFSTEAQLRADVEAAGLTVMHSHVDRHRQRIRAGHAERAQVLVAARHASQPLGAIRPR